MDHTSIHKDDKGSNKEKKIFVLGSGTSTGIPIIGCSCPVCQSPNEKNKRLRTSILIETSDQKRILIDTSTDLRTQLLRENITTIDSCIMTHDHADHVHGIDDLRPLTHFQNKSIPIYTNELTANGLKERFAYIFQKDKVFQNKKILGGGVPRLHLELIPQDQLDTWNPTLISNVPFQFFHVPHSYTPTLAFQQGKMAYIVDCKSIPQKVVEHLKKENLELLIIDCLKYKVGESSTHLDLDKALHYISAISPQRAGLIHLSHEIDHEELTKKLSQNYGNRVFPVYDGQTLTYS